MAAMNTTLGPPTTVPASKANYNWATMQLNIVMLPVGLSLLLIVSLTAILCHCLRKKRLKRMAKDLKRQKSGKNTSSNTQNGLHRFESFTRSPVRPSSTAARRDDSVSPRHPATLRKKKIEKKRMSRSIELNLVEVESGRKRSRRSVSPASDRPPSKNAHRNGEAPIEHRASGIPVPILKSSRKEKRKSSAEKTRSKERRSSLETGIAVIDREDPYKIDMDKVRSTRDRRRWEVPATHSIEYDRNGAIRLPPLLEIRMAKTA